MPESSSVPFPTFVSEPPTPEITPLTSVERSFEPTSRFLAPSTQLPAPSIEPAVVPPEVSPEISSAPPLCVMKVASPPLAVSTMEVVPPFVVVMVASPTVVLLTKKIVSLLVIVAFSAVAV